MHLYPQLLNEYNRLSTHISSLEKAIAQLPEGSLTFNKNGSNYRYYKKLNGKRIYLSKKDWPTVEALAKKKYLQKMLLDAKQERGAIGKYLSAHNEEDRAKALLTQTPHLAEILDPLFSPMDKKLVAWANADYPSSAGHPEHLIHKGPKGKMYRSKSEADIAHCLYKNHIPYRYEWDKYINGITYHIDFTIRHPKTGETFYWEHCGRMDKDGYSANVGTKIKDYESAGIFPDRNLILSFESKQFPFEYGMAEEIVERWFL